MSNILFVGDLRSANNYGAIATSESLMKIVQQTFSDCSIQYIDHRSFKLETPPEGFPVWTGPKKRSWIKKFVFRFFPKLRRLLHRIRIKQIEEGYNKFHVPCRWDEYQSFTDKVVSGKALIYEFRKIKEADLVIINSEGSLVHGTDKWGRYRVGALYVLYMAYLSKVVLKKKTAIINHSVDTGNRDADQIIDHVYPLLDYVAVREKLSMQNLIGRGHTNIQYVPDALFTLDIKPQAHPVLEKINSPYICIGDSSGFYSHYSKVKWDVSRTIGSLVEAIRSRGYDVIFVDGFNEYNEEILDVIKKTQIFSVSLQNCNYLQLSSILKGAEIFISGRWHNSILSILMDTPILLWGADSYKTLALYDLLNYKYTFFDVKSLPLNIDRIVREAEKIMEDKAAGRLVLKEKVTPLIEKAKTIAAALGDLI